MGTQHTVLIVMIKNDEGLTEQRHRRHVSHAASTIQSETAWFDYGSDGNDPRVPMRFPDRTYRLHAPSTDTLEQLKEQLLQVGLILVGEVMEEGTGNFPADRILS